MKTIKTDLDAFEYVVQKLTEQNEKSMDMEETCRYRGWPQSVIEEYNRLSFNEFVDESIEYFAKHDATLKCAVGHLISDLFYIPEIEGEGLNHEVYELVKASNPDWETGDTYSDEDNSWYMLNDLQKIHDSYPVSEWGGFFDKMRENFNEDQTYGYSIITMYSKGAL